MTSAAPDSTIRVAATESAVIRLGAEAEADSATLRPRIGEERELAVDDNAVELPAMEAPDLARIDWKRGGETLCTTYVEVVSRHYFPLDALKGYGHGQDDFGELPDDALFTARQAATEVFERNARRSFVARIGRTKDYGRDRCVALDHGDVRELLTEGYELVSDCHAVAVGCFPRPCWVEYVYGYGEMPAQVSRAVLELAAYMLRPSNRPIGATGESTDAGFISFTTAGRDGYTDVPEVNAAIEQFGRGSNLVW